MSSLQHAHVQNIYRPISIIFGLLVILLIGSVIYAGWSSSIITVTPKLTTVTASFPVTVGSSSIDETALSGTVATEKKSATVTVNPKGTGTPVLAHATGQVTIKNTTAKDQPLTGGTRLKSTSDIIVRTTARVDVPAGGSVVANVVADPLGETGNLPPDKFIIVALWPGLQDKIYGESTAALTGGLAAGGTTLSLDELTAASNQAEENIRGEVGVSRPGLFISLDPTSVVTDPKPEVVSTSYAVTVTVNVTTVTYTDADLAAMVRQELIKALPANQELVSVETPSLSIDDRPSTSSIILHIESAGSTAITSNSPLLQPSAFTDLSVVEIQKKLGDPTIFTFVKIKLSPWWRTTAPDQAARITVVVNPAQS